MSATIIEGPLLWERVQTARFAAAAAETAKHIHDTGYCAIMTSGNSASEICLPMFRAAWQSMYDEPHPGVFDFQETGNRMLYLARPQGRSEDALNSYIKEYLEGLDDLRSEPLVFLDDHAFEGKKFKLIHSFLPACGFTDTRFAAFVSLDTFWANNADDLFIGLIDSELASLIDDMDYRMKHDDSYEDFVRQAISFFQI